MAREWPTTTVLLGWFLYDVMQGTPPDEVTPELIIDKIEEFLETPVTETHQELYMNYDEFRHHYMEVKSR